MNELTVMQQAFLFLLAVVVFVAFIAVATGLTWVIRMIWIALGECDARGDAERDAGIIDQDLDAARAANRAAMGAAMRQLSNPNPTESHGL